MSAVVPSTLGLSEAAWKDLKAESVGLLSRLLAVDTSNPPGNETRAATVLKEYLAGAGITGELAGEHPQRLNLVARLPGRRPGPTLVLLGHTDVVPAEPEEWSVPPFSGAVQDGYVWGRGATDMKNQVVAQAVGLARVARAGADFAGEVIYVATCDEESGEVCGARWLAEERPDLVRCDFLLNEGGGAYSVVDGVRVYPLTVGEKGFAQFNIRTRGQGGHGSVPLHERNAVEIMGRAIAALADHELPVSIAPFTADYITRIVPDPGLADRLRDPMTAREAVREMLAHGNEDAYLIEPLLGITFSPTIARAGGAAVNVIPSHAEVDIDCRILPGQTSADVEREVAQALDHLGSTWEIEWVDVTLGNESPVPSPLSDAIDGVMETMTAEAAVVPLHLCGFTDSRWFREAFPEVIAYGFCPFVAEDTVTMGGREHAADERIAVDDVPFQTLFVERLIGELLA